MHLYIGACTVATEKAFTQKENTDCVYEELLPVWYHHQSLVKLFVAQ